MATPFWNAGGIAALTVTEHNRAAIESTCSRFMSRTRLLPFARAAIIRSLWHVDESQADPVFLNPGDSALADRGVARHHQAKTWRHERRVLNIDGRAFGRDISHDAAHHGPARRHVSRFVDFGPWMLALLFHRRRPLSNCAATLAANIKQYGSIVPRPA